MRIMLAILALAALAWTGWWFFVAYAKERAIEGWLAERRAEGWVAEASAVDVAGFPYRVDTTVSVLHLANPDVGWAWSAPEFQFLTLAYQPNHLIAFWPQEQSFSTPLGTTRITSETMQGSVVVEPNLQLALRRATVELDDLTLADDLGWSLGVDAGLVSARQSEDASAPPFTYDLALSAEGMSLPEQWGVDRAGVLSEVIEQVRFDGAATFDRALDRPAVEGEPPALEALEIRDVSLNWGRLDLRGQGALRVDGAGFAEGRINLRARNWEDMLDMAQSSGALNGSVASALRAGLGLLARLGGDSRTLDAPLEFAGGVMRLGPVPIGPAPRLGMVR